MLHVEILVGKLGPPVDAAGARSISLKRRRKTNKSIKHLPGIHTRVCVGVLQTYIHKVSSLDHEIFDYSMEGASFIARWNAVLAVFASTELSKRGTSQWFDGLRPLAVIGVR